MSILSAIQKVSDNIAAAYTKLEEKGATLPEVCDSSNLADTIDTVPAGGGEVRGGWTVPPLYSVIDAATDDETNEVYQKCMDFVSEDPGKRFSGVVGFALPVGYYRIFFEFSGYSHSFCPDAILTSDGRKIYNKYLDSENGYDSTYTLEFNNMDGQQYLIFYYVSSEQCWDFKLSSSAKVYIDSSTQANLGGYAKYVAIKPVQTNSSYFVYFDFSSSYYLDSFNIIGELPTVCKKSSISKSSLRCSYNSLKYFPPILDWCATSLCDSFSGITDFVSSGYPLSLPYGLDLSQYSGSGALQIGTGNTSVEASRMSELYVTLPSSDVQLKGVRLSQENWNYLAEHAPTVSNKTLTITGGYIGSSSSVANPTAAILGEAYTTFVDKGWTIAGLGS